MRALLLSTTVLLLASVCLLAEPATATASSTLAPPLTIRGNRLLNAQSGTSVFLGGVNSPGAVFPCIGGYGVFDHNISQQVLTSITSGWNAKIIRFGLNEDCVLGINGVNPKYSGANYLSVIKDTMERVLNAGLYLIIELHWTGPGTTPSNMQQAMPDAHSSAVWTTIVQQVLNPSSVDTVGRVFLDLFQEPFPNNNEEGLQDATWECWKTGSKSGQCVGWNSNLWIGMADLVTAVRQVGSKHQLLLGGVNYANGMYKFTTYAAGMDPLNQVFASYHNYKGNACSSPQCWNATIAQVAQSFPVLNGEVGETDCASAFLESWTSWLKAHNAATSNSVVASLAWVFDAYSGCSQGPSLVTDVDAGTCTPGYGCWWQQWLLQQK